jgi:hypothetical protein
VILGWTVLQPSARERRLWMAAIAAAATIAVVLAIAALALDPRHPARLWVAAGIALVAAGWGVRGARQAAGRHTEVSVASDGAVQARPLNGRADALEAAARCAFVAPWLITLKSGGMLVPVWPDALSPDAFRRLHACARWGGSGAPAGADNDKRTGNHNDTAR